MAINFLKQFKEEDAAQKELFNDVDSVRNDVQVNTSGAGLATNDLGYSMPRDPRKCGQKGVYDENALYNSNEVLSYGHSGAIHFVGSYFEDMKKKPLPSCLIVHQLVKYTCDCLVQFLDFDLIAQLPLSDNFLHLLAFSNLDYCNMGTSICWSSSHKGIG
ncbi:hypothetical protein Ahy_A08g038039 isoform A [Arachis hypogaea]|uniref:Uncharacterized protein n=1 Tax=Arachis hypogaea TaxID=3818 RepID=A0A445BSG1_ARAHY|nr:hypothetical protein Ahy_A08g038039 isoform A [Arachis hypogaea]